MEKKASIEKVSKEESAKEKVTENAKEASKATSTLAKVANAVSSVPPMVLWMVIIAITLPTLIALMIKAKQYDDMIKNRNSIEKPLEKMRNELAELFEIDILKYDNRMAIEELLKLDKHIQDAKKLLEEEKTAYSKLFQEMTRSSHGWQLFGRSLYYTAKGKKSWYDAEYFCRSRGAHLASILSDEEQNFITAELRGPAWIGLTDKNEQNNWEWIDGSELIKQYWSESASNVSEHHGEKEQYCASVVPSVGWNNWNYANCHKRNGWLCKETLLADEL